jgi:hypothetical protein
MLKRLVILTLALIVAGCGTATPTPTPTLPPPSVTPAPTVPPTATSLAEGWFSQSATPDPSPNCPDHYPWYFPNPVSECATTVLNTWAVMQRFERGLMVWFQEGGRVYLMLDDGSQFKPYVEAADTTTTPLPEADPGIVPPAGLYQPVLGFGKFWRGMVPGYEWVRERLGWALAPEVAYSSLWQCNNVTGDSARCYFTGPRDEILVVTRGASRYWAYWQGPVR